MRYLYTKAGVPLAIFFLLPFFIMAQELRKISGAVIDESSKEPLVGAIVKIKDVNRSTVTTASGNFQISAKTGETLEISYLGYRLHTVKVGSGSVYNVALKADERALSEVVVIGYGSVARPDITGAIAQVKMADLEKAPVASFEQALQGRVAGVAISATDGQPGEEMNIVIRGGNSLTQSNAPLYVIDGFPVEDASNLAINPDDIESMTILKDASSTSIYGARGANGVIMIETKKGKVGAPVITFNNTFGVQQVQKTIDLMNAYEFVKYQQEFNLSNANTYYLSGKGKALEDYINVPVIDWQDEIFRTSLNRIHNIGIRGGNTQTRYSISGSLYSQDGIIINTGYDRYQGRVVIDQMVGKKIKTGININVSKRRTHGGVVREGDGATITSSLLSRVWAYRPVTGNFDDNLLEEDIDAEAENEFDARFNPVSVQRNAYNIKHYKDLTANAYLEYKIIPTLTFRSTGTVFNNTLRFDDFYSSKTPQGTTISYFNSKGVNASVTNGERLTLSNNNTLTFRKTYDKIHSITALAGIELQSSSYKSNGFSAQQLPNEVLGIAAISQGLPLSIRSSWTDYSLFSVFGRFDYSYKSKYIFTGTLRSDASSKFKDDIRWGYFPATAIAWNMHQEDWFKQQQIITSSKIRASYGLNGNNRIGEYTRYPLITLPIGSAYSWGNASPTLGAIMPSLPTEGIKWETTENFDIGLDMSFLKGKFDLVIDLYRKNTRDLLMNAQIPTSQGFSTAMMNIGSVRNQGIEFTLGSANIKTKNFSWNTDFNISFNQGKILKLNGIQDKLLSYPSFISQYSTNPLYISEVGGPVGMFYGFVWDGTYKYSDFDNPSPGVYNRKPNVTNNGTANARPGDIKYRDLNGDLNIDVNDLTVIGRGLPIHTGGFNNNFGYKGFSLNVFFQWSYGNDIYNSNRLHYDGNGNTRTNLNQYATYQNRWSPENPDSDIFRAGGQGTIGWHSSRVLEDGSYLRLKTVALDYSVPVKFLKPLYMKRLNVGVSGQNLITWTKYSGMDPEVSTRNTTLMPGFDYSAYPMARTLVFTLKSTF